MGFDPARKNYHYNNNLARHRASPFILRYIPMAQARLT